MNLLPNPNFLLNNDTFYFDKKLKIKYGESYKLKRDDKKHYHEFDHKSNFSPIFNDHVSVIEYIEGDPMYLNGFAMPSTLNCYTKSFEEIDHKRVIVVEDDDSLPMLVNLFDNTVMLIQETNLFCSVLAPQQTQQDLYILSFTNNGIYIIEPTEIYLSGHIQPKIECIFTIPKQEKILFAKQRKQNPDKIIQIKSVRELQIKNEHERIKNYFKYLLRMGKFNNENNIFIVLYTLSCFIMHNEEVKKILKKIENFINSLRWTESLNFFSLTDESKLGKHEFLLQMLKICRSYFNLSKLEIFDGILLNYIKNYNKIRDNSQFSSYNYVANIKKKKLEFIKTKKEIIKFVYFLEYDYFMNNNNNSNYDTIEFENFLKSTLKNQVYKIKDTDLELDLILNDCPTDYNYENLSILKNSEVLQFYSDKRKKGKNSSEKTKSTQIKYSNIFFESSHTVLNLNPELKRKFSNPLKVFMNKRRKISK